MTHKLHLAATAFAGILFCSAAGAQTRGAGPASRVPEGQAAPHIARPAPAPTNNAGIASRSRQQARGSQNSRGGRVRGDFSPIVNSANFDNRRTVPGLGFDYPHLAAIGGNVGGEFGAGPGRNGHRGQGFYVAIPFGAYPTYYADSGYDQAEQQPEQPSDQQPDNQDQLQPQNLVTPQPDSSYPQSSDSRIAAGNPSASEPPAPTEAQVPDVGDFILVQRDGRILFASLYTVVGTQVRYISRDGIRHTIAMADLDPEATQQMNEARGTTVQLLD